MNLDQVQKTFEKKLQEELEKQNFPAEKITVGFKSRLAVALPLISALGLGADAATYRRLLNFMDPTSIVEIDLYAMSFALNAVGSATPNDLNLSLSAFAEILEGNAAMIDAWNAIVLPIRQKLMQVKPQQEAMQRNGKKVIPLGARNRSIKGK